MPTLRIVCIVFLLLIMGRSLIAGDTVLRQDDDVIVARVGNLVKAEIPIKLFKLQQGVTLQIPDKQASDAYIVSFEYTRYDNDGGEMFFENRGPAFSKAILADIQKAAIWNKIVIDRIIVTCPDCQLRKLSPISYTLI